MLEGDGLALGQELRGEPLDLLIPDGPVLELLHWAGGGNQQSRTIQRTMQKNGGSYFFIHCKPSSRTRSLGQATSARPAGSEPALSPALSSSCLPDQKGCGSSCVRSS